MGDRKLSQLLRRLQQLLGDKAATFDQAFLREFFLKSLPSSICLVLVPAQWFPLEKIAELADSVMDVSYSTISLGALSQPPTPPSSLPTRVDLQSLRDTCTPRSHVSPTKYPHCLPPALFRFPVASPHLADVGLRHLFKPASAGKLPTTPLEAASGVTLDNSRLFFIRDPISGLRFLVDTGAEVSVLPCSSTSSASHRTGPSLQSANLIPIATHGEHALTLNLGRSTAPAVENDDAEVRWN
ncbi:uncharacterized protein LOC144129646 [Amblyomma americanum]